MHGSRNFRQVGGVQVNLTKKALTTFFFFFFFFLSSAYSTEVKWLISNGPDPLFPPLDPHLYNNNLSNLSLIKKTAFTDSKEEFVNRIREKEKRK